MRYNVHVDRVSMGQYDTLDEAHERARLLALEGLDAHVVVIIEPDTKERGQ